MTERGVLDVRLERWAQVVGGSECKSEPFRLRQGVVKYMESQKWSKYPDCALSEPRREACISLPLEKSWGFDIA